MLRYHILVISTGYACRFKVVPGVCGCPDIEGRQTRYPVLDYPKARWTTAFFGRRQPFGWWYFEGDDNLAGPVGAPQTRPIMMNQALNRGTSYLYLVFVNPG